MRGSWSDNTGRWIWKMDLIKSCQWPGYLGNSLSAVDDKYLRYVQTDPATNHRASDQWHSVPGPRLARSRWQSHWQRDYSITGRSDCVGEFTHPQLRPRSCLHHEIRYRAWSWFVLASRHASFDNAHIAGVPKAPHHVPSAFRDYWKHRHVQNGCVACLHPEEQW